MNIKSLILLFTLCTSVLASAAENNIADQNKSSGGNEISMYLRKITPESIYGYTDFDFNSTKGENFNRYRGHSNLYSIGADHISLGSTLMAGLYYFRVDTALAAKFLFTPGTITTSDQTIKNQTLFGHILKIFSNEWYADLSGGFGYNQFNTYTVISPNEFISETRAAANNNNDNWFVSFNGIYRKSWQQFLLRANLGVLYSQIDTGRYNYYFPATEVFYNVKSLTNRATLLLENAEIGYYINPKFMPFINGGLAQVVQFSNSRPIILPTTIINGIIPQYNMNKNAFRLGAGFSFSYKNVNVRVEERYYNASSTFKSYQTLATLEYQFY